MKRPIFLLTDFGHKDIYVGVMKGVIARHQSDATIFDLCHEIPRQNVEVAALMLRASIDYCPAEALHVVVVDPGVGSARKILYAETDQGLFLAPDNGVLSLVLQSYPPKRLIEVCKPEYFLSEPSNTFHGRDKFAQVAGQLISGLDPAQLGPAIEGWKSLYFPECQVDASEITGKVVYIDVFGNVVTNVPSSWAEFIDCVTIEKSSRIIEGPVQSSYAAVRAGLPLLIGNSFNVLELAINQGSAAEEYELKLGDRLVFERKVD